jgi:hypothetical protein
MVLVSILPPSQIYTGSVFVVQATDVEARTW